MAVIVFDPAAFRVAFPAYASMTAYPDATLQLWFDTASGYVSAEDYGYLSGQSRVTALNLMTAHLIYISGLIASGQGTGGYVTSSTIDKISVTMQAPPAGTQFEYWLNLSPYGLQLLSLLQRAAAGGFYIGGSPERFGFRSIRGF